MLTIIMMMLASTSHAKDICDDIKLFNAHAKSLKIWSDYETIVVRCSSESIREDSGSPLSGMKDKDLKQVLTCIAQMSHTYLQKHCTLSQYISYESGLSPTYQRDLLTSVPCAVATSQLVVVGPAYLQACLNTLKTK
jgi:hypothetical protein